MKKNTSRPRKWVSDQTLAAYFEVSRHTIWRWVKDGKIPQPKKLGDNCTRFDFEEIQARDAK